MSDSVANPLMGRRSGIVWANPIPGQISTFSDKLDHYLAAGLEYESNNVQSYARTHAPWTDQTGNARQGLFAESFVEQDAYIIVLFHTMPYGVYLETRFNEQYAVIKPTIKAMQPRVMATLRKIIERMK